MNTQTTRSGFLLIIGGGLMVDDAWNHDLLNVIIWEVLLGLILVSVLAPGSWLNRPWVQYGWQLPDGFVLGPRSGERAWVRPSDVLGAGHYPNSSAVHDHGTMVRRYCWQRRWRPYDWRDTPATKERA